MSTFLFVVGVIISVVLCKVSWDIYKWFRDHPFRWKCPQCNFTVKTDIRETYEISKSSHNHASTKEFKDTDPWRSRETLEACKRFHPGEPCMPGKNHPGQAGG